MATSKSMLAVSAKKVLSTEINGIVRKVTRLNKRVFRIVLININYILNENI